MADPFDKLTRNQGQGQGGGDVVTEFEIPTAPVNVHADTFALGGLAKLAGVGNKPASMRVRILRNGDVQYFSVVEGEEPKRVVPTDDERAMIEQIIKSRKEANPPPAQPPARTPEGARKEAAEATLAEANAQKAVNPPPAPTITRATAAGGTESVSKDQADYDLRAGQDQRQAALDLQARLQQAETAARDAARLRIEQDKWTAEQAATEYNKSLDAIRQQADAEVRALTQRGQDITVRGQDVAAGTTQRGQNLDYETALAQNSTSLATAMLPYLNAPGQIASTNSLMGGGPPVPTQPMAPPYDPLTFPAQAAMQARGQMPSPYQLPGAPPPVPPGQYQLPR